MLRREHETLVEEVTQSAFALWPAILESDAAMRAKREDLSDTLRAIAAATLVDDRDLVTDYVEWFESVLTGHGLPIAFVFSAFELFLAVLPTGLSHARDMATSGREACSKRTPGTEYSP